MTDGPSFLPYGRQWIDDADVEAVVATLRGDWLTQGPAVEAFEAALAETTGASHAVACATGTAALHLAALGLGLGDGDAAVVPAVTFLATANAVRYVGAEVVFADVDPDTGLMGPHHLEEALARAAAAGLRVRAVFPVHLAGQTTDAGAVARTRGLAVVEDACHALGGSRRDADGVLRPVGSCPDGGATALSFHPVKTITTAEGGAITTNDPVLAERMRRLRSHGMTKDPARFSNPELAFGADGTPNPWYYEMPEIGFNYRITDLQCALGLSQLRRLDAVIARRRALVDRYEAALAPLAPLVRLIRREANGEPGWHLCVALIDFDALGRSRAQVMADLREHGIGTQVHYLPVNRQPYYRDRYGVQMLPGAEAYYRRCLSLPLYYGLRDEDVDRVAATLAEIVRGSGA